LDLPPFFPSLERYSWTGSFTAPPSHKAGSTVNRLQTQP
jgi:hypothetical protein